MATTKKVTVKVALDVKKLSEELDAVVKEGKLSTARGKYYVTVGATKKEIVVGDTTPEAEVKALAGQSVAVVMSGRSILAIGSLVRRRWILCYLPVPDIFKRIREELRGDLLNRYAKEGLISDKAAAMLKSL